MLNEMEARLLTLKEEAQEICVHCGEVTQEENLMWLWFNVGPDELWLVPVHKEC